MNEPLVLLPGMMCDARLFAPQIAKFSSARGVMVAPLTGDKSFAGLAQSFLRHAPPRFALAGLSMGGIAAMEIIRQAPERISRLALLDTNPLVDPTDRAKQRNEQMRRVAGGSLQQIMRDEMKPHYLAKSPNRDAVLDLCMDMALALGADVFITQSCAVRDRPDQCETLRGVKVPTLILCGAEDRLCPVERHQMMQGLITGAELVVIDKAGHLPTIEQPQSTNEALEQWLKM
ncbi:MAG: alpha/beta fold hydrolase [Candidatus Puniceispirillaceae bacterium]